MRCAGSFAVPALICLFKARTLFAFFMAPFRLWLPEGRYVTTYLLAPLTVPLSTALWMAFYLSLPVMLWHVWRFVAQGLYRHERHLIARLLCVGLLLFYAGFALAYWGICPWALRNLHSFAPEGLWVLTDVQHLNAFVWSTIFWVGLAFQLPLVLLGLHHLGLCPTPRLAQARPYVILGSLVVGMLLTPPDVISQVIVALPLWLLFELALGWLKLSDWRCQRAQKTYRAHG